MTEKYTPEKVAQLVAESRVRAKFLLSLDEVEAHFDGRQQNILADALTAVSAERDEAWRVASEQTRMERDRAEASEADRDRLHKAITEALAYTEELDKWRAFDGRGKHLIGILRAALDKEGQADG